MIPPVVAELWPNEDLFNAVVDRTRQQSDPTVP